MQYYKSKYVLSKSFGNGDLLLWNLTNSNVIVLNEKEKNNFLKVSCDTKEIFDYLVKYNFLVEEKDLYNTYDKDVQINKSNFTIALTEKCNAKCYYCYQSNCVKKISRVDIDSIVQFLLANFSKSNSITWFGGEPLLEYNSIIEICNKLNNENINYKSKIVTNGFLLKDLNLFEFAKTINLKSIQITLDGLNEDHLFRKGVNEYSFNDLMSSIETLIFCGVNVNIRINVSKYNYEEVETIFKFLDSRFSLKDNKKINVYCAMVSSSGNEECYSDYCFNKEQYTDVLTKMYELEQKYLSNNTIKRLVIKPRKLFCGAYNNNSFFIDKEGNIYNCEHHIWDRNKIIGNINDGHVNRKKSYKLYERYESKCKDCVYFPVCKCGCIDYDFDCNFGSPCNPVIYSMNKRMDDIYKIYCEGN